MVSSEQIEPAGSPYSSPIMVVRQKNGTWRMCMDFHHLNSRSVPDACPIQASLDRLRGARYIITLDLKDGYWEIPLENCKKAYEAFTVPRRAPFQWKVMPFRLHSVPAPDSVIRPHMEHAFTYLDAIIVIGRTLTEHLEDRRETFCRLRAANLRINVGKYEFTNMKLKYLGHVVSEQGIQTNSEASHQRDTNT